MAFYTQDRAGNIGSEIVTVIKSIPTPSIISGYNIFLLIGIVTIISAHLLKRLIKK